MALGLDEIRSRFGFRRGTPVGQPGPTPSEMSDKHAELRALFVEFAGRLDEMLPDGRAKDLAFTELEAAGMWSHKALSHLSPVYFEGSQT